MEIVGIDFGTTNIRISTWNPDDPDAGLPQPRSIGRGDDEGGNPVMPVVVALQRQPDDSVFIVVGEEADLLEDGPNTLVIRDIKRWAQASDSKETHIRDRLDTMGIPYPTAWEWKKPESGKPGYIEVWGRQFQFKELMGEILKEAILRADLPSEFEWRAGCPVHAGIEYRSWLNELLSEFSGKGNLNWIADEPVLLLTLLRRIGNLAVGSYLVYDLGGGSFDCALIEVRDDNEMIIYGTDGHPLLGGSDIDRILKEKYDVPVHLLRLAKEQASPDNPTTPIRAGVNLLWADVEAALKGYKFIPRSLMALHDAYVNAKVVWGRGPEDYPFGETIFEDDDPDIGTGNVRFIWQLSYDVDMPKDLDGIILFGGPTQSPFFAENLRRQFGNDKVMLTKNLVNVPYAELVALSMGACYFSEGQYSYMVPTRLPIRITLENLQTGETVEYEPYQHFASEGGFLGAHHSPLLLQERDNSSEYKLTVTNPDGVVLKDSDDNDLQLAFSGFMEPRKLLQEEGNIQPATSLQLIIDRLGYIWVEMKSEGVGLPWTKAFRFPDVQRGPRELPPSPPWQTKEQREAWQRMQKKIEQLDEKKRQRLWLQLNNQPWRDNK